MICSAFRNEGDVLSSTLIREALAATRWKYPTLPSLGMITFVNREKTRAKKNPGYCFIKAGFTPCGRTKGGLYALQMLPDTFPRADQPIGANGMLPIVTLFVLDPAKLPGTPKTLPKGWGANDWDCPDGVDVLEALRGAVAAPDVPSAPTLVSIDPTYPVGIELPPAIISLEPDKGIPLPAGEVGILAGQGGERKSTLTIQMAIAAAAAEDGALVSPFTGLTVNTDDPFIVKGGVGLAVRGGPVCMATWEDAAPWLAKRARACAEYLDAQSDSTRHTRVLTDASRLASVQLGSGQPLYGVTATDDRYMMPHPIVAGWDRLWDTVRAISATFVTIDPINLAAVWTGYGAAEVGAFMGAIRDELGSRAGALLVGHTGKAAAKADEPSALDILGSGAWSARARSCFVARSVGEHYELHLVKANYAPRGSWAYAATATEALALVDIRAGQRAKDAKDDADVLKAVPAYPDSISPSKLADIVFGGRNKSRLAQAQAALDRLMSARSVNTIIKRQRSEFTIWKEGE